MLLNDYDEKFDYNPDTSKKIQLTIFSYS